MLPTIRRRAHGCWIYVVTSIGGDVRGIILAGGTASRFFPVTRVTNKHLLPIYSKPVIYYPLSTLIGSGVKEILLITSPKHVDEFTALLGDGTQFGISIIYSEQKEPRGLPDAFIIGERFVDGKEVWLILGDNLFWGSAIAVAVERARRATSTGACIFPYHVKDPRSYGVVELDTEGRVIRLEEKPKTVKPTHMAVPGLYLYDGRVSDRAKALRPSPRSELEISDLNEVYRAAGELRAEPLSAQAFWTDVGTPDSLLNASNWVAAAERQSGLLIGSPELAALDAKLISIDQCIKLARAFKNSHYGMRLMQILSERLQASRGARGEL
jgi:glucose-1-phosphate thymidylyltransferase